MKHFNFEPDITGPFEGEPLGVILGFEKPEKYRVQEARVKRGIEFHVFKFPKDRVVAAFKLPQRVEVLQLANFHVHDILQGGQLDFKEFSIPQIVDSSWEVEVHDDGDCDPDSCPIGYHYCDNCGDDVRGPLNEHDCVWTCSEHDRTISVDESCDACIHESDSCDPHYCGEGEHTCPNCGQVFDYQIPFSHERDCPAVDN